MKTNRIAIVLFSLLAFSVTAFAQGAARTDEWRGLKLGVSSTDDAIERLGDPSSDKLNQKYRTMLPDDEFDSDMKGFRVLKYDGRSALRGFKSVHLYFRDDVLLVIRLKPHDLKASALERAYDSEFEFVPDRFSDIVIPGDHRRGRNPKRRSYPMFYYLVNETEEAHAIAAIDNNSVREVFGDGRRGRDRVPGKVRTLDLVSTELLSDDGADLLK